MDKITNILKDFSPISLTEMDRVKLLNRTDTKFIFNVNLLPQILNEVKDKYAVLEINNKRYSDYQTLYFDNDELKSYIDHHNGKLNRIKIRFRKYINSKLNYLEVKFKNNKGRTIKSRIQTNEIEEILLDKSKKFIEVHSFYNADEIKPVLWNNFSRITLVHKTDNERLTIDMNLSFNLYNGEKDKNISHLIIAEVKQEKMSIGSDFIQLMRKNHIKVSGMSKYCIGTALLNKKVKSNNFKERILNIKKLKYA